MFGNSTLRTEKSIGQWGMMTGWRKIAESLTEENETITNDSYSENAQSNNPEIKRSRLRSVLAKEGSCFNDDYEILDEIGSGAFGKALKAKRLCDKEVVVVKEISASSMSDKEKDEMTNEVKILAYLNHPNIVKYFDFYSHKSKIHIVMEFCEEGDLAKHLKLRDGKLLEEDEIMLKFVQICLALKHIHSKGILHRDLKTQNIFISRKSIIKLGDFGISRVLNSEQSMAKSMVGTPYYLSPELCEDKPYGCKSDVWSLGCVLYELCTLKHAFDGQSLPVLIFKILSGKFPPVPESYSNNLRNLVNKILCKNPMERPSLDEILNFSYVRTHLQRYGAHIHYCIERRRDSFLRSIEPFSLDCNTGKKNEQGLRKHGSNIPIYKVGSLAKTATYNKFKQNFFAPNSVSAIEENEGLVEITPYRFFSQDMGLDHYQSVLDGSHDCRSIEEDPLIIEQTIAKQKLYELKLKYFGNNFKMSKARLRLETLDEEMCDEEIEQLENDDQSGEDEEEYQSDDEENKPVRDLSEEDTDDDLIEIIPEGEEEILVSSPEVVAQIKEIFQDPLTREIETINKLDNVDMIRGNSNNIEEMLDKEILEEKINHLRDQIHNNLSIEIVNRAMDYLRGRDGSVMINSIEDIIGKENLKYESLIYKLFRDECVLEQLVDAS